MPIYAFGVVGKPINKLFPARLNVSHGGLAQSISGFLNDLGMFSFFRYSMSVHMSGENFWLKSIVNVSCPLFLASLLKEAVPLNNSSVFISAHAPPFCLLPCSRMAVHSLVFRERFSVKGFPARCPNSLNS